MHAPHLSLIVAENHFFNELKHITSGYASFDYEESQYETADIVKMDVNLNGVPVDALSRLIHRSTATAMARSMAQKMREVVDRQQFDVAIQVCVEGKAVARETFVRCDISV